MDNLENSDKNISLPFDAVTLEENVDEEIEVLDDPKRTAKEVFIDTKNKVQTKAENFKTEIQNESIFENNNDIPLIRNSANTKKKMDRVLKIQIALVVIWVVLTVSIYFFGYELFEPIIPINQ